MSTSPAIDRFFEALNRQDYAAIHDLVQRPMLARSIELVEKQIGSILSDVHYRVESTVTDGSEIWVFCTLHGIHTGEFPSPFGTIAPTNRAVVVEEVCRFRLDGEKIDLVVATTDLFGLLTQIAAE